MSWKPRNRKLFMFTIPNRPRIAGSVLYSGNSNKGMYSRAEDCFVIDWASDCRLPWTKGQHCLIDDGFESEPTDLDMWEQHCDDPAFAAVSQLSRDTEGKVKTSLIHEDSIIAVVED